MKENIILVLVSILILNCSSDSTGSEPQQTNLTGPYMGQTPPGRTAQMFIPDIITTEVHSTTVFSPDGREVFWTPMEGGVGTMKYMYLEGDYWFGPLDFVLDGSIDAGEPCYSSDGGRLYFTSRRASQITGVTTKENIWFTDRTSQGWSDPVMLGAVVNDIDLHWSFSISDNNNIYYAGQPLGNDGTNDIYCAEYENGQYVRKSLLGEGINTPGSEDTPFIAPDESYLIFARVPNFQSYADLFICFRDQEGNWGAPINMENINTYGHELCPNVTSDGEYLFFISTRSGSSKPYWVSADVINDYRL